jgi:hypothetical protein
VAHVVIRMEANEVSLEDSTKELFTVGECPVVLGGGEGCVEEEANLRLRNVAVPGVVWGWFQRRCRCIF